jgi:hypothetical protein
MPRSNRAPRRAPGQHKYRVHTCCSARLSVVSAINQMKQTQEWKEFSRINLQSSMEITLEDMQRLVASEIKSDREFLESSGFLK